MFFPSDARTATGTIAYSGAVTQTDTIFATSTRTILQYLVTPGRFVTNVTLRCSNYDTLFEGSSNKLLDNTIFQMPCYGAIELKAATSQSAELFWTLTYVDYDITELTSDMATDTPYTGYTLERGGETFTYNPLQAQIGIFLFVIAFLAFVCAMVWTLRKL